MKFKVGDKVKLKPNLVVGRMYGGDSFEEHMKQYIGMILTIIECDDDGYYIDDDCWHFTDEMLEPVQRTFKDLKKGDYVTIKNNLKCGQRYNGLYFNSCMSKYCGNTYEIDDACDFGTFGRVVRIKKDTGWRFSEDMIESFMFADEVVYTVETPVEPKKELVVKLKTEIEQSEKLQCIVTDMVNTPPHYLQYRVEVIDVIEDVTRDMKGIEAVCIGNVLKYIMRYRFKNGVQDLKKARYYLDKVIGILE